MHQHALSDRRLLEQLERVNVLVLHMNDNLIDKSWIDTRSTT